MTDTEQNGSVCVIIQQLLTHCADSDYRRDSVMKDRENENEREIPNNIPIWPNNFHAS